MLDVSSYYFRYQATEASIWSIKKRIWSVKQQGWHFEKTRFEKTRVFSKGFSGFFKGILKKPENFGFFQKKFEIFWKNARNAHKVIGSDNITIIILINIWLFLLYNCLTHYYFLKWKFDYISNFPWSLLQVTRAADQFLCDFLTTENFKHKCFLSYEDWSRNLSPVDVVMYCSQFCIIEVRPCSLCDRLCQNINIGPFIDSYLVISM